MAVNGKPKLHTTAIVIDWHPDTPEDQRSRMTYQLAQNIQINCLPYGAVGTHVYGDVQAILPDLEQFKEGI